ncbi:hypothetical protein MVEN_00496500 [Mycena venus]|uniref:F-box domain-containing protein n=1 Tax=Mycena venus TaxID=2733690 RepID=A0A8H6YVX8_9AGAR|nr:hypothetical protein MVEN_00496500 [Mycena venus]
MHRCWDVAELTQTIFQELDSVHYEPSTGRRITKDGTLYRLALTCRKFCDPALDMLWENLYDFIYLLKCLPPHIWEISERSFRIRSPVGPGDWNRVLTYSKRIRDFSAEDHDLRCRLDASVLQSLVNSLPTGALIPNLRSLSCQSWSILFPHLSRLVGEHVTKIYIEIDGPAADLPPIARRCRSLRHVDFNGPHEDSTREWVSAFLIQLTHLQTVKVFFMNKHAFRHVAGLEHLENLWVISLDVEPFPGVDRSYSFFPALSRLTLWAVSVIFATNFVKVLDRAPLETLVVAARQDSTTINSRALFWAIHSYSFTGRATLTSITVELAEDFDTVSANTSLYAMSFRVIQPLLGFPNLRRVKLSSPLGFILDNEFVDAMAHAWSRLESLSIKGQDAVLFHSASKPTIMALHSFSRHCPHLRNLSLLVDATNVQMNHPLANSTDDSYHPQVLALS